MYTEWLYIREYLYKPFKYHQEGKKWTRMFFKKLCVGTNCWAYLINEEKEEEGGWRWDHRNSESPCRNRKGDRSLRSGRRYRRAVIAWINICYTYIILKYIDELLPALLLSTLLMSALRRKHIGVHGSVDTDLAHKIDDATAVDDVISDVKIMAAAS